MRPRWYCASHLCRLRNPLHAHCVQGRQEITKNSMSAITIYNPTDFDAITRMEFGKTDVLTNQRDRIRRHASLLRAAVLEGINHCEVLLLVEDLKSVKKLRSRIIATGNDRVLLERGLSIPVHCIRQVEFLS